MKALEKIGLIIVKSVSVIFMVFMSIVLALVPIGFAFEIWDWITGK